GASMRCACRLPAIWLVTLVNTLACTLALHGGRDARWQLHCEVPHEPHMRDTIGVTLPPVRGYFRVSIAMSNRPWRASGAISLSRYTPRPHSRLTALKGEERGSCATTAPVRCSSASRLPRSRQCGSARGPAAGPWRATPVKCCSVLLLALDAIRRPTKPFANWPALATTSTNSHISRTPLSGYRSKPKWTPCSRSSWRWPAALPVTWKRDDRGVEQRETVRCIGGLSDTPAQGNRPRRLGR